MGNAVVKQHEPLRVPESWSGQERRFVYQIEEILDDLYKSFSRITINDLQPKLAETVNFSYSGVNDLNVWKTETNEYILTLATKTEVNGKIDKTSVYQSASDIVSSAQSYTDGVLTDYSTTTQTSTMISQYVTNNAYELQSGIEITAAGIDISGSQYVKIASGGYFQVKTGNFGIDTESNDYVIWAGASSANSAPFWLKKNGELFALSGTFMGTISYVNNTMSSPYRLNIGSLAADTGACNMSIIATAGNGIDHQPCISFLLADDTSSQTRLGQIGLGAVYNSRRADLNLSPQANWDFSLFPISNRCGLGSSGYPFATVWASEGNFDDLYYGTMSAASSIRVKHNVNPIGEIGPVLDALIPSSFIYNGDESGRTRYGLVWEETVKVLPEICLETGGERTINYIDLIPLLLKEIQSLRGRIREMENRK